MAPRPAERHLRRDGHGCAYPGWTCRSDDLVATQGHVLSVDNLLDTLVVEATIHHLDMTTHLHRLGPHLEPLAVTRATLDGLLGRPTPDAWSSQRWLCTATGRAPLTEEHRSFLGTDVDRLPLLR